MKKFFTLVLSALLLSSCGGGETASSSSIPSGSKESSVETSTTLSSSAASVPSESEVSVEETSIDSTPITSPSVSESEETSVHTHTFDMENWSHDGTHHWHDSTCGHEVVSDYAVHDFQDETIAPTFEKGGYTLHTCKVCGYSYQDNETDPKEHVYSNSWSYNEEGHYHACLDEGFENDYVDFTRHSFDAVVTPATIGAGGFTTYTCSVCSYSYRGDFTEPLTEAEFYMEFALNPGDDSYALVAVKNSPEVLHIPALYEGLPVTRIGAYAFANSRNTLKEVYLGENIDTLDDGAFSSCILLEHVEISPNLSIVHEGVFNGCPSLRYNELKGCSYLGNEDNPYYILLAVSEEAPKNELILPEETKIIATYDLKAAKIKHVVFPDGLIDIPVGESFIYISQTTFEPNYLIEGKLRYMGSKNNPHLLCVGSEGGSTNESSRNYVFHEDTRFITYGAFYWLGGTGGIVASATFAGDNMLEIGGCAFMDNRGLRDFVYPSTIKKLGRSVLAGCNNNHTALPDGIGIVPGNSVDTATKDFAFPSKAYGVRASAFSGAYDLEDVDLSQIEWADQGAFDSCSAKSWVLTSRTRRFEGAFSGYYSRMNTLYFRGDIMDYLSLPLGNNPYLCKNAHLYLEDETGDVVHNGVTYTLLENVVLPDGMKEIPDGAFYGKIDLKTISIPDSVVSIGRDAFADCSSLAFACVDGLKYLGNEDAPYLHCFGLDGTSSSSEVVIVDGCRTIAGEVFKNKTITSVTLPDSLVYIGDYAFNYCSKLTTVIGGSGLTALGQGAFSRCGITSIDISNVVDINNSALANCQSLQTIALSDRLEKIREYAFYNCSSLVMTLALPETLTSIGANAFSGCSRVTGDVVIPDSVDTLGSYAFDSSGITSLHLGANVPADVIFGPLPSLTGYTVSEDNAFYQAVDGVLYDADMISLISYPAAKGAEEYTLPETVTRLETYCFAKVNIPNFIAHENITYFGSYAFSGSGLTRSINGATYLGVGENQYYYLLEVTKYFSKNDISFQVPEGVVFMASEAIEYEYYLKYIYLPSTIQSIGYHAIYSLSQFISLYYAGTMEQWGEVDLADKWFESCNGVSVVGCKDGTVAIA